MKNKKQKEYVLRRYSGEIVNPGEFITSVRGESLEFRYISKFPERGHDGEIIVMSPGPFGMGDRSAHPNNFAVKIVLE